MTSPKPPFAPLRISTDGFPVRQRLNMWREIFGRNVTHVDIDPVGDGPFHASATFQSLPGVGLASGTRSAACYRITERHLVDARDGFGLTVLTSGAATTQQLGREVTMGPGSAIVTSGTDPSTSTMHKPGSVVTIALPRPQIAALIPDLGAIYATHIPAENEALRLLLRYIETLHRGEPLGTLAVAEATARHIVDLAALTLGAKADAAEEARQRGLAAARLEAIKAEVRDQLVSRELSVTAVAARFGVSTRYLHKLFEREGMSFSEFVVSRRLARALQMLTDARSASLTISAIAFDCGFSDLSYFYRRFRRAYGATPSELRQAAHRALVQEREATAPQRSR